MNNPWHEIRLSDYENHMSLDSVKQLQTMNTMMKKQFETYPVCTAMVLGVAGGNGLEHICRKKYKAVYGIDINAEYLKMVVNRYSSLEGVLQCMQIDLIEEADKLPQADMIIANLLIEYIGYEVFQNVVGQVNPKYVSCGIQLNLDQDNWISDSPYLHAFDQLDTLHHQVVDDDLERAMIEVGYRTIFYETYELPNGKCLIRMDFQK